MLNERPLIELSEIVKAYDEAETTTMALAGVDLAIAAGEFLAITGPSGCGKTTLLALLGLLDAPTSGSYHFEGAVVDPHDRAASTRMRNRNIGFIFQSFHLIGDLTVGENVMLPLDYRGVKRHEAATRATAALEHVGMARRLRAYPGELSGGEQQRVAIARAIVGTPRILLADEPTGSLDSANGDQVMSLIEQLHADGTTVCLVTHEPRFAARADRVVTLLDGRVVA